MVLDSEGVSKAATDRTMYVRLKVAYDDGHRVATAIAAAEQAEAADRAASVLLVTSDLPDLTRLVAGRPGVAIAHVGQLGRS
jgi:hypothetical protein